ncbi:hypothetical protein SAMN06265360_12228 [Haloechinothrix alba]|uniref:Uncharacterized protein n=1 Tax=Haloechinothrix alba TaxID=664784 RepID=A0A238ZL74_9PSEU|nr:hypothetical protein SAMN06265360_12228 [Haloechinothrix alba]
MSEPEYLTDSDARLLCPECGRASTRVDQVFVTAREEDAPANEIIVDAIGGDVVTHGRGQAPVDPSVGEGRRHRVALVGRCEEQHRFALVLTQVDGETRLGWSPELSYDGAEVDLDDPPW